MRCVLSVPGSVDVVDDTIMAVWHAPNRNLWASCLEISGSRGAGKSVVKSNANLQQLYFFSSGKTRARNTAAPLCDAKLSAALYPCGACIADCRGSS